MTSCAAASAAPERAVLYIVMDKTGSMGSFIKSLATTLPQVFDIAQILFEGSLEVRVVSYEDYCNPKIPAIATEFSAEPEKIMAFAARLRPSGGGDCPEATRTAFNCVIEDIAATQAARALVVHYTDAPPHHAVTGGTNWKRETEALKDTELKGSWVGMSKRLRELQVPVFTFLPNHSCNSATPRFHALMGTVVALAATTPEAVTRATVGLLTLLTGSDFEERFTAGMTLRHFDCELPWDDMENDGASCGVLPGSKDGSVLGRLKAAIVPNYTIKTAPFKVEPVQFLCRDLGLLAKRFKEDVAFQDVVFRALARIFTPTNVSAVTYNPIIGTLWRLGCRMRGDERLEKLKDALSLCVTSTTGAQQAQLQEWIEESYDMTEEILEIVNRVPAEQHFPAFMLDPACASMLPDKKTLRSITQSPTKEVLQQVQAVLTHLMIVKERPKGEESAAYIPLAMASRDVFQLVPHLVCPGSLFSLRPSGMLAILAFLANESGPLREQAEQFLEAWKGQWIPSFEKVEDFPEIMAAEFVRLVHRVPQFLTEEEAAVYHRLYKILRLRLAKKAQFTAEVPYIPKLRDETLDHKVACTECKEMRSLSLVLADGRCAICFTAAKYREAGDEEGVLGFTDVAEMTNDKERRSHLVQCRTEVCSALYAVVQYDKLGVAPKCYYCRENTVAPTYTCVTCQNRFVMPPGATDITECAQCQAEPSKRATKVEMTFGELVAQNKGMCMELFGFSDEDVATIYSPSSGSLFKLYTRFPEIFAERNVEEVKEAPSAVLHLNMKPILNTAELMEKVRGELLTGSLEGLCCLCYSDCPVNALQSACGKCNTSVCSDCLGTWYRQAAPGQLVLPTHLTCPFCKRQPSGTTLKRFNRPMCTINRNQALAAWDPAMFYAWCAGCYQVKPLVAIECGGGSVPEVHDWNCEGCRRAAEERRAAQALAQPSGATRSVMVTKTCPACQVETEKDGGCHHMACTCGAHWCWTCGEDCTDEDIYDHLLTEHGGIFGEEYDEE